MTKQELDNQIVDKKLAELSDAEKNHLVGLFALGNRNFGTFFRPIGEFNQKLIKLNILVEKKEHKALVLDWGTRTYRSTDSEAVLVLTTIGKLVRDKLNKK